MENATRWDGFCDLQSKIIDRHPTTNMHYQILEVLTGLEQHGHFGGSLLFAAMVCSLLTLRVESVLLSAVVFVVERGFARIKVRK